MAEPIEKLITHNNPKSPISEAYRMLRTNIQFSSFDKPLKTILVTSTGPSEGKTTTVCNLAVTFAQSGSTTLVIDADLRKPKVHKVFNTPNIRGLTNILVQKDDFQRMVNETAVENLYVLTCGAIHPNPSELLASNAMKSLIEQLRDKYDIILIDSPPVGTVTDAAILSTIVDGTILVAASGVVEIEGLKRSKELLDNVNANIIGVVLNKLDKTAKGNYYYYYYYYYGEDNKTRTKKRRKKKHRTNGTIQNM